MSSSSSPGVSLMMEGISYIAGTEIPMVLVDVMRGGPGLGNIAPAQADYNQIVHGGGHGDYQAIVLAPASVQESIDLTVLAFDLAEKYRSIAVVLTDGSLGQMMEPCEMPPMQPMKTKFADWAVNWFRRARTPLPHLDQPEPAEAGRIELPPAAPLAGRSKPTKSATRNITWTMRRFVVTGFGSTGRVALSAVRAARAEGIKVGLHPADHRQPVPAQGLPMTWLDKVEGMLVVEMNAGQMLEDVIAATEHKVPVEFYARMGGVVPFPDEILDEIHRMAKGPSQLRVTRVTAGSTVYW